MSSGVSLDGVGCVVSGVSLDGVVGDVSVDGVVGDVSGVSVDGVVAVGCRVAGPGTACGVCPNKRTPSMATIANGSAIRRIFLLFPISGFLQ